VAGILKVAAGLTLHMGASGVIAGLAHLQGVIANATTRNYAYDFRLAALLLVGITIANAGALTLGGARPRAWSTTCLGPHAERHPPAAARHDTAHSGAAG
jgi:hypothetical protein